MDLHERTRRLAEIPPYARRDLIRLLTSSPEVRAHVIRQFFEREDVRGMAEVLMDLEEDEAVRETLIEGLNKMDS
jgi:hypothetical protein